MINTRSVIFSLLLLIALPSYAETAQPFRVIVHRSSKITTLPASDVAVLFMKKVPNWKKWGGSEQLIAVDLNQDSYIRADFSKQVLAKSVRSVTAYWQQQVFSGRDVPPVEMASEEDVIAFVGSNPGAIGYVGSAVQLPPDVHVIAVTK